MTYVVFCQKSSAICVALSKGFCWRKVPLLYVERALLLGLLTPRMRADPTCGEIMQEDWQGAFGVVNLNMFLRIRAIPLTISVFTLIPL